MNLELKKRIITSIILLSLMLLMYHYTYILIISIIIITLISWIEFYGLISKIFYKKKMLLFFCKTISLVYFFFLNSLILYIESEMKELKIYFIYSVLISIASDIGGITFGKFFKGKKLTQISPNKTISGSLGSFIFSISLIPFFYEQLNHLGLFTLIIMTVLISLFSQIGDLLMSFIKRKAKVKNTSNLLPGHGGFLDRIDGMILSIPVGIYLLNLF